MVNVDFFADNNVGFDFSLDLSIQANNVLEYICNNEKCTSKDLLRYCDGDENLLDDILDELLYHEYLSYENDGYHVTMPKPKGFIRWKNKQ